MKEQMTPVSYELAVDLAYVANDAFDRMKKAEGLVDAAKTIEQAAIPGTTLEVGELHC